MNRELNKELNKKMNIKLNYKKNKKRIFALLIALLLFLSGIFIPKSEVRADNEDVYVIMMVSKDEGKVGDNVTITVSVTSDKLTSMTMYLNYPSQIFKYTGGDFTESNGFISYKLEGSDMVSANFTAVGSGSARFYTSGSDAKDAQMNQLTVAHAGATVVIQGDPNQEGNGEGSETETETETEKATTEPASTDEEACAEINGEKLLFVSLNEEYVPKGFIEDVASYKTWIVPTYVSPNKVLKVVALQDDGGSIYLYCLDESSGELVPYAPFTTSQHRYVIKDKPKNIALPDGFEETVHDFGYGPKTVYQKEGLQNVVLVYAINLDGAEGLYYYDTEERVFFQYIAPDVTEPAEEGNTSSDQGNAGTGTATTRQKDEGFFTRQNLIIISITLASLFLIMSIVAITLMLRNSKQQNAIEELEYEMYQMEKRRKNNRFADHRVNSERIYEGYRKRKVNEMEEIANSTEGEEDDPFPEGEESGGYGRKNSNSRNSSGSRKNDRGRDYDDYDDYDDRRDYDDEYDDYDDRYDDRYDDEYDDRYDDYDDRRSSRKRGRNDRYDDRYDDYEDTGEKEPPKPLDPPTSGETIEIVLVDAEDNNRSSHVPPAVDKKKTNRVEEAMKERPFGIDSAFNVVDDEADVPEEVKPETVDRGKASRVKREEPQKIALPGQDEEDEG